MQNDGKSSKRLSPITIIFIAIVLLGLISGLLIKTQTSDEECYQNSNLETKQISLNGTKIQAEVAVSSADQTQGLSDRNCLGDNKGMLFVYDQPTELCFWMKDMNFSIDMIWLDQDKKVTHIEENASPESYPDTKFCPETDSQYVLEVEAGKSAETGLKIGDQLSFN